MTWNNYPNEIRCPDCDGSSECECWDCNGTGEYECSCCGSVVTCDECSGTGRFHCEECRDGLVGLDFEAFDEAVKDYLEGPSGTYELIEDGIWVGRAAKIGEEERKLYYLDFIPTAIEAREGKRPYAKPNPYQKSIDW